VVIDATGCVGVCLPPSRECFDAARRAIMDSETGKVTIYAEKKLLIGGDERTEVANGAVKVDEEAAIGSMVVETTPRTLAVWLLRLRQVISNASARLSVTLN
jgi:type IV secretory pathway protease TraF